MRSFLSVIFFLILFLTFGCNGNGGEKDLDTQNDEFLENLEEDFGTAIEEVEESTSDFDLEQEKTEEQEIEIEPTETIELTDTNDTPEEITKLCNDRTGGALITLRVCGTETMTEWFQNSAFIDEAIAILSGAQPRVPVMTLLRGTDCDPQWSWHVDPMAASWADVTIELCDGCPSHVESDLEYWLGTVHQYCPWSATVISVDDRR